MSICAKRPPGATSCRLCACAEEVRQELKLLDQEPRDVGVRVNDNGGRAL